jgi:ABC-type sugar transport system ATPase subunit
VISRPLSAFEGVQKYFGAVYALRDIDLFIGRNEIVRLSSSVTTGLANRTRIKVITGVLEPTSRRIFLREHEILPGEILSSMAHDPPIETVYRDKSQAEKQPLSRNFFVGRQITNRFGFIDVKRQKGRAQRILHRRDRLPRRRHHRGFDGRQSVREGASGHRDRPGHALQRRPHRAQRPDSGANRRR